MTRDDLRIFCTALGFTAVVMQGGEHQKDRALRATGLANLIEEFCRSAMPELLNENLDLQHRMADTILDIMRQKGECKPHDLRDKGFSLDEIARHWPMAYALAEVNWNLK